MSTYETLSLTLDERGIAVLCLNRAEKHNAMNAVMITELADAARRLGVNEAVRVVVLAAAGETFCAGGDLGWMRDQTARDRQGKLEGARALALMLKALDDLPKPLIGKVQGNAFGGGIGLMSVCDIVMATGATEFALTETRLGLIPATIGPYVVRRIGEGNARRLLLNARRFDAETARDIGLVSTVVPSADLDETVEREAVAVLDCAPGAVAATKALIRGLGRSETTDEIGFSVNALADRWESAEGKAGIEAFFSRAPAPWAKK